MSVFDSAHSTAEREAQPFVPQPRRAAFTTLSTEKACLRPRLYSAAPPFSIDTSQQYLFILLQESMVSTVLQPRGQGLAERRLCSCLKFLFSINSAAL